MAELRTDDVIQPFRIDSSGVRGRLVRMGPLVDRVFDGHDYPEPVCLMLGETLALAVALAHALRYDGVLTLQTQGDGPVGMMVVDVTSGGEIRGYAHYDGARLEAAIAPSGAGGVGGGSVPRLLGTGYLALTVDQGPKVDRYQGVVELMGPTLADCVHHYFRQSADLDAAVRLAAGRAPAGKGVAGWRAASLMVQRLSFPPARAPDAPSPAGATDEEWRRALAFMGAARNREMLDPDVPPRDLLYRLFHEDGVRAYRPVPLSAGCRCSRERVRLILRSFPRREIEGMKEGDAVVVTCEFCGVLYRFDDGDLDALYEASPSSPPSPTPPTH